jgi:hypothetical protein
MNKNMHLLGVVSKISIWYGLCGTAERAVKIKLVLAVYWLKLTSTF